MRSQKHVGGDTSVHSPVKMSNLHSLLDTFFEKNKFQKTTKLSSSSLIPQSSSSLSQLAKSNSTSSIPNSFESNAHNLPKVASSTSTSTAATAKPYTTTEMKSISYSGSSQKDIRYLDSSSDEENAFEQFRPMSSQLQKAKSSSQPQNSNQTIARSSSYTSGMTSKPYHGSNSQTTGTPREIGAQNFSPQRIRFLKSAQKEPSSSNSKEIQATPSYTPSNSSSSSHKTHNQQNLSTPSAQSSQPYSVKEILGLNRNPADLSSNNSSLTRGALESDHDDNNWNFSPKTLKSSSSSNHGCELTTHKKEQQKGTSGSQLLARNHDANKVNFNLQNVRASAQPSKPNQTHSTNTPQSFAALSQSIFSAIQEDHSDDDDDDDEDDLQYLKELANKAKANSIKSNNGNPIKLFQTTPRTSSTPSITNPSPSNAPNLFKAWEQSITPQGRLQQQQSQQTSSAKMDLKNILDKFIPKQKAVPEQGKASFNSQKNLVDPIRDKRNHPQQEKKKPAKKQKAIKQSSSGLNRKRPMIPFNEDDDFYSDEQSFNTSEAGSSDSDLRNDDDDARFDEYFGQPRRSSRVPKPTKRMIAEDEEEEEEEDDFDDREKNLIKRSKGKQAKVLKKRRLNHEENTSVCSEGPSQNKSTIIKKPARSSKAIVSDDDDNHLQEPQKEPRHKVQRSIRQRIESDHLQDVDEEELQELLDDSFISNGPSDEDDDYNDDDEGDFGVNKVSKDKSEKAKIFATLNEIKAMKGGWKDQQKKKKKLIKGAATTEPIEMFTCTICLENPSDPFFGEIECHHQFCFSCISSWSKVTNICPMCRTEFSRILKKNFDGSLPKKDTITDVRRRKQKIKEEDYLQEAQAMQDEEDRLAQQPPPADEPSICYKCFKSDRENLLLICDVCDDNYCHTFCDEAITNNRVPSGRWSCHFCRL